MREVIRPARPQTVLFSVFEHLNAFLTSSDPNKYCCDTLEHGILLRLSALRNTLSYFDILTEVVMLNVKDAEIYAYGLTEASQPSQKVALERYVRGGKPADTLRWNEVQRGAVHQTRQYHVAYVGSRLCA